MKLKQNKKIKQLWAFDCETDPFKFGVLPEVFLWCAVSEFGERVYFEGENCTELFVNFLQSLPDSPLIAHNGGRYDTQLLAKWIHGDALIVDGRILRCYIGNCEMRDSMAILPMSLAKLDESASGKIKIDIDKLSKKRREKYKDEIRRYCFRDCEVLLNAVQAFYTLAGRRALTIASVASSELRELYPDLPKLNKNHYDEFKPFYFGGRCGVLGEKGELKRDVKLYDVNSMYPAVMRNCKHPFGSSYKILPFNLENIPADGCGFFSGEGFVNGCFPIRDENGNTPYPTGYYKNIKITIAELKIGFKHGLCKELKGALIIPCEKTDFRLFVDKFFGLRKIAKKDKNKMMELFYKLVLNSAYGRFCMSPDGRDAFYITSENDVIEFVEIEGEKSKRVKLNDDEQFYKIHFVDTQNERYILSRPVARPWTFYEDIATGAHITGCARAVLLDAIYCAVEPLYCDTDSLLCTSLDSTLLDDGELGKWKLECEGDRVFIGGKKLYAIYKRAHIVKKASKGVRMSGKQIALVARGEQVTMKRDAPALSLSGVRFTERRIKMT